MTQHDQFPATGHDEQPVTPNPERQTAGDVFVANFDAYVENGENIPVIRQDEVQLPEAQAKLDAVLDRVGQHLGFEVKEHMDRAEAIRHESDGTTPTLKPWMKGLLGIDEPEKETPLPSEAIKREILLKIANGREYWLTELRIPNRMISGATSRDRTNALLYCSNRPVFA